MFEQLVQLIGSVGFPIVACIVMGWYVNKQTEAHKEETDKLRESLDNNTLVLTRILDRLDGDE